MITVRKLSGLAEGTRQRKIVRVLEAIEQEPASVPDSYIRDLLTFISRDSGVPPEVASQAQTLVAQRSRPDPRSINMMRHALMRALGMEPADWDLAPPLQGTSNQSEPLDGVVLYAEDIRSPFNLGSIVRTAAAFGVRQVVANAASAHYKSRRFARSAMGAERLVELSIAAELPQERGEVIALETGGTPVSEFRFPRRGVLMLGSEELGLSPGALAAASRRVSIPLAGAKGSLNVGVAVGIALSWWAYRRARSTSG
ncbi:MAG: TrmH family RNA methyltransferase [Spirochaetota bacterium]